MTANGLVQEVVRFAAIGLMVSLSANLLRRYRGSHTARIGAAFALCMADYLLIPFVLRYTNNLLVIGILLFPAFSNAFLLWMLCRSLFSDHARWHGLHYSLWGLS